MKKFEISNFFSVKRQALSVKLERKNPFPNSLRFTLPAIRLRESGYTLIELLMYMGVFLILLLIFFQILGSVLDAQLESESASTIEQDGKFILSRLTYDIQQAQTINTPSQPGIQTTNAQVTINSILYTYAVSGGNLQITNNNGTDNLNSYNTSVSNFTIKRIGNQGGKNSLSISFTLMSKVTRNAGIDTKTYQTTIATR